MSGAPFRCPQTRLHAHMLYMTMGFASSRALQSIGSPVNRMVEIYANTDSQKTAFFFVALPTVLVAGGLLASTILASTNAGANASPSASPSAHLASEAAKGDGSVNALLGSNLADLPEFGSNFSNFMLNNGLQVVVIPDHRAPVVTHMIWYKVGAADEQPGQSGIAHFLEHLMFKGTKAHPDGAFSKIIASIGGQENAFTSQDYTAYYQRVAKQHLGLMMEMEADRMANLVLRDDQVAPELQVVLEERASRIDNNPSAQLGEALSATLYRNHPYGIPIIGWEHEIKTLNRETALDFYNRFYTPNNAVLVVAGDVTAQEVRDLAEKSYGKVERRAEVGPRIRTHEPPQRTARTVTLRHERVTQPSVQRSYMTPSETTAAPGEAEALDVLGYILGAGHQFAALSIPCYQTENCHFCRCLLSVWRTG